MDSSVEITNLARARVLGTLSPLRPCSVSELARDCRMTNDQVQTVIKDARKDGWPILGSALKGFFLQLGRDARHRQFRKWLDECWDKLMD